MISHKHKTIFVHIPKAAGTSIERIFMKDLGINMNNRHALLLGESTNNSVGPRRVSHLTAEEYVDLHFISHEIFNTYYKFSIVRHPCDRLLSSYKYRKYYEYLSFDSFIKYKLTDLINSDEESYFYKSQFEYLYNSKGKLLVDYVGKVETLEKDFRTIKKNINIKNCALNKYNKSNEKKRNALLIFGRALLDIKNYKNFSFNNNVKRLSKEAQEIILKYYRKDFETFGYNFSNAL